MTSSSTVIDDKNIIIKSETQAPVTFTESTSHSLEPSVTNLNANNLNSNML